MASLAEHLPRLEKYEVLEEIGHGGMATVYRAKDRRLGRDVAVKVIHRHLRENKEVAARFVSEARAVAKLKHPNIVEVYDVSDEDESERYLVVELVVGTTLRKLLANRGHMPAEVAAAFGIELGGALEHAHGQGVIHRDVKPENVLVDLAERVSSARGNSQERPSDADAGRVKITDFGIAKLLDAQGVTSTGQVLGSPAHMAPEQIEGGDVTARADVFGVGVLLYECMVGRLPFEGKNPAQVLRKVLDGTFTPPERARPSVGLGLSRVVERALAREQANRYASAAELCEALRKELDDLGFDNPRRELAEYLATPESYCKDYEERVVKRLVELGKGARAERQAPQAAAHFNRALAFRPDDVELLRQVAGLAQTERLRRLTARVSTVAGVALVAGLAAYGIGRKIREPRLTLQPDVPLELTAPKRIENRGATPPKPTGSVDPDDKRGAPRVPVSGALPDASANGKTRSVRINVVGAKSSLVKIDGGEPHADWNTYTFELSFGKHTLDVQPPNSDCCEYKGVTSFVVIEGDGPQPVTGFAPFRDAILTLTGDGAQATCGALFQGVLLAGAQRKIKIPGPESEVKGQCTITGPPAGSEPKRVPVTLGPNVNRQLSW